jgi:hypothetical protein
MELRRLLAALILAVPALASAQGTGDKKPAGGATPPPATATPPPAEEEAPIPDDFKVNDDPNDPDAMTTRPDPDETAIKAEVQAKVRFTKADYPIEAIMRPLTLVEGMAEVGLDIPFVSYGLPADETGRAFTQVLRAGYGVTEDIQIGLTYNFGLQQVAPESHYEAGKAFSVDALYNLIPGWLALQVSLPFYVDPFAMSLTLGAPFRLKLHEKIAIIGGQNLLQIKFVKFPVDPENPAYNVGTVAGIDAAGQGEPDGNFNLLFGALFQAKPNLALSLMVGTLFFDFKSEDAPFPLWLDLRWSKSPIFDFGARAGTQAMDDFGNRIFVTVYTAYRI